MTYKKQPIPSNLREKVFKRDGYTCRYCGDTSGPFQADHVYPERLGGVTTLNNLVTSCKRCNVRKHMSVGMWPKPIGFYEIVSRAQKTENDLHTITTDTQKKKWKVYNFAMVFITLGVLVMYGVPMTFGTIGKVSGTMPVSSFEFNLLFFGIGMIPTIIGGSILLVWRKL